MSMRAVIDGNTEAATLLASGCYWDGHAWVRNGKNRYLFRKGGGFFLQIKSLKGRLMLEIPVSRDRAKVVFSELVEKELSFQDSFPEEA